MRTKYIIIDALRAAALGSVLPAFALYYRHHDVTLFQIAILAAAFEGSILLMELPSGIWADRVSRRAAMIISQCLLITAGVLFISFPGFWPFLVAEMIMGWGEAFGSGALDAWVVDEEQIGRDSARMESLFTAALRWKTLALVSGALGAGALAAHYLDWVWVPFTILSCLALLIVLLSPEHRGSSPQSTVHGQSLPVSLQSGMRVLKENTVIRVLILFGFLSAFAEEGVDEFWQVHLDEVLEIPVAWFGVIVAVPAIVVFVFAPHIISRLRRRLSPGRAIGLLQFVYSLCIVGFAVLAGFWSPLFLMGVFLLAEIRKPILAAWTNEQIESVHRAGFLSFLNLVSSGGESIAGLCFGLFAGLLSLPLVFLGAGFIALLAAGIISTARTTTAIS